MGNNQRNYLQVECVICFYHNKECVICTAARQMEDNNLKLLHQCPLGRSKLPSNINHLLIPGLIFLGQIEIKEKQKEKKSSSHCHS